MYAFAAPTVNCLKRRRPHTFSPSNISWGMEDRSALIRVKQGSITSRHLEYRAPSGLANPYLTLAAFLAAGIVGVEGKLRPPRSSEFGKPAEDDPACTPLPWTLHESFDALDATKHCDRILGDEFVDIYLTVKRHELRRYEDHVSDWESMSTPSCTSSSSSSGSGPVTSQHWGSGHARRAMGVFT